MIKCLLWDFGDTLCDERFIWSVGPDWMAVYETFDDGVGERWNTGDLDSSGFARELSATMGRSPDEIVAHMIERSTNHIEFYDYTWALFRERRLPQAIVTVNPDLFSDVIVPAHDLQSGCEVIVTSWEERSIDKSVLCSLAIERLDAGIEPGEALLIDNKQANIEAWASVGGAGYHYTTDDAFRRDVERGLIGDGIT